MSEPLVSHGRGGHGNIAEDSTPYTDGEIVREGPEGQSTDGAFSTGRGGGGNIGSPGLKATKREDTTIIPETALRSDEGYENYHTGRGGEGNIHKTASTHHEGLADKLKHKILGKKADDKEEETKEPVM